MFWRTEAPPERGRTGLEHVGQQGDIVWFAGPL